MAAEGRRRTEMSEKGSIEIDRFLQNHFRRLSYVKRILERDYMNCHENQYHFR